VLFYGFNKVSPPPGLGVQVNFDVDGSIVIDGVVQESGRVEKGADVGVRVEEGRS
jgi:NCS1 family nucleobase:cation symporter-1